MATAFVDDLCVHLDSLIGLGNVCAFSASVSPEQTQPELVEANHDSYYVSAGLT